MVQVTISGESAAAYWGTKVQTALDIKIDPEFKAWISPLSPEEFAQLEENILADGCRDPLVLWNETLLDGHNRYEICTKHGLPFKTEPIDLPDREAAKDWLDRNQLGRRNLTPDQRSLLRGRRYNRAKKAQGGTGANQYVQSGQNVQSATAEVIASQHGVNERTIRRDGKRAEFIEELALVAPEEAQAVREGKKRINEVRRILRRVKVKEAAKLPDAKFRVLYADPPWKYGDQLSTEGYGPTKFHYPTMTIAELCNLPVKGLCEPDAVLFLWVTAPLFEEALPVVKAWGFEYKTHFIWYKLRPNFGHYHSARHELLLVCTRGSCLPDVSKLYDSVISIERKKHSEKPEEFRSMIDALYPHGRRLELFARKQAESWDTWGNQVDREERHTQEEIAEREGISHPSVTAVLSEFSDWKNLTKSDLALAEHAVRLRSADLQRLEAAGELAVSQKRHCVSNKTVRKWF